tara:strand:- start:120 stop:332 length:213 start_codon:yes stop_codon:yes gene_type:complete
MHTIDYKISKNIIDNVNKNIINSEIYTLNKLKTILTNEFIKYKYNINEYDINEEETVPIRPNLKKNKKKK